MYKCTGISRVWRLHKCIFTCIWMYKHKRVNNIKTEHFPFEKNKKKCIYIYLYKEKKTKWYKAVLIDSLSEVGAPSPGVLNAHAWNNNHSLTDMTTFIENTIKAYFYHKTKITGLSIIEQYFTHYMKINFYFKTTHRDLFK